MSGGPNPPSSFLSHHPPAVGTVEGACLLSSLWRYSGSFWRVRRKLSENGYIDIVGNIAETGLATRSSVGAYVEGTGLSRQWMVVPNFSTHNVTALHPLSFPTTSPPRRLLHHVASMSPPRTTSFPTTLPPRRLFHHVATIFFAKPCDFVKGCQ